jgi:hypothetical protein
MIIIVKLTLVLKNIQTYKYLSNQRVEFAMVTVQTCRSRSSNDATIGIVSLIKMTLCLSQGVDKIILSHRTNNSLHVSDAALVDLGLTDRDCSRLILFILKRN